MTIQEILKQYWNHQYFRPLQEEIISAVLEGKDALALLPTGGGKSVCFQVPALAMPGICLVISPLIALMKDQVENLQAKGINAMSIVSGMSRREIDIALDNCIYGEVKFLYMSPERLLSELVQERIKYMKVNLIAVDEAHCISQWGYDFRPSYLHIAELRNLHPQVPILALTATATANVRVDIIEKLQLKQPQVFLQSFERKNISYLVEYEENKLRRMLQVARGARGSGIIYVRSRKDTFELARFLNENGLRADYYHAGLSSDLRSSKQENWKNNVTDIMVATNAFGMGIDKPDVRFVIHRDLPESLEAYYQEAGRAGRDEKRAYAVLLYNIADRILMEKKFEASYPTLEEMKQVYHYLANYFQLAYGAGAGLSFDFDLKDFCTRFKLDAIKTLNALKFLEQDEYLSVNESVFLPSRFRFEVMNEQLYNFQIQNPGWDPFIKVLLRSYGGAFDHYINIREFDLAKRTGTTVQMIIDNLNQLQEFGILNYLPQTDKPQITYLKPRQNGANMLISINYINERKQLYREKMEAVFNYTEAKKCRSQMLLIYFDEDDAPKCGLCDICLQEKRQNNKQEIAEKLTTEIIQQLSSAPLTLDQLINAISGNHPNEKLDAVRLLLDAGKVKTNGDVYYL
ncbi:RecQ family ATP-dependent DNA helicase [Mucilaginibacter polytrichastri]|uniref:ATP-dependent DNA helicase RecQ n=1 Tax=Mucilaginibacter polytrichastri TaxID=1302689 RepID=A0A1Q5ZUR3_9SPHI|nr:ATP-dependent DNA helicase RecQ [Mucilaginibacter polytrichastri]OKS85519.1 ATP-dependent DNA helicase recQ [Mucilaginibacter polytrichastri]SFS37371.1 ATP-dependent DNA helicase RecQ [Mucilaginibacter polytrichastri]